MVFVLKGGKRVGRDFQLYRRSGSLKIPLSKIELRNRLEDCGELIETSSQYIKRVNNLFFGFQNEEEYKELLELLIQIRSPKLSNNFKPTKMIEILNDSLITLSNEDLHILSESIKKMDELKINLQELSSKIASGEKIEKVFLEYSEELILRKMRSFYNAYYEHKDLKKKINIFENNIEKLNKEIKNIEKELSMLSNEYINIQIEKKSLENNNSTKLKEEYEFLKDDLKNKEKIIIEKKESLESTKYTLNRKNTNLQEEEKNISSFKYNINRLLDDMENEIDIEEFPEFLILKEEFLKKIENEYDFSLHREEIKKYEENLEKVKVMLFEYQELKKRYSLTLERLEKIKNKLEYAAINKEKHEIQVQDIKEELVENIYTWHDKNLVLKLTDIQIEKIIKMAYDFDSNMQFEDIRNQILFKYEDIDKELKKIKYELENSCNQLEKEVEELNVKLIELESTREIEPEKSEKVLKNRKILKDMKIPFIEFYKCVDFPINISQEIKDNIEEAIFNMGLLDALVVDPVYKKTILSLPMGICDKYIFITPDDIKSKFYSMIEDKIIDFGEETFIGDESSYKIGLLEGTISREYKNYFIGIEARRQYKENKINLLKKEISKYNSKLEVEKIEKKNIDIKIGILEEEKNNFPTGEDVLIAYQLLVKSELEYDVIKEEHNKQKELMVEEKINYEKKGNEIFLFSKELRIPSKLNEVEVKLKSLKEYVTFFNELVNFHYKYINSVSNLKIVKIDIEDIEDRLDSLMIDIKRGENEENKIFIRMKSIEEQMKMSDYIAVKEKLDYCIKRYNEIPDEKIALSKIESKLVTEKENLDCDLVEYYEKEKFIYNKLNFTKENLINDAKLNYSVYSSELLSLNDNIDELEKNVRKILGNNSEMRNIKELEKSLYSTFHENKSVLTLYKISLETIFGENRNNIFDISTERFDIRGRLNGKSVSFQELIKSLKNHEQELSNIFTYKDEELFKEILSNTISKKIRLLISQGKDWIEKMNRIMKETDSGSGIVFSLAWKNKNGNNENELDSNELVNLLGRDIQIMKDEDFYKLSNHFRSKINDARIKFQSSSNALSFEQIIKEVLDYRQWFHFQLYYQKTGEKKEILTDSRFSTFSGGEKAMAMYIPLFAAAARYKGAKEDAPKIMALDEAFAGIDNENIEKLCGMMKTLDFNFIFTSQALLGTYSSLPGLSIYHLARHNNKFVTTLRFIWDGKKIEKISNKGDLNEQ